MPDPSNPTTRVMDVINFLAAHPTETFTLAEIARHVGLSNGSAHRLLTTLAAGQYLSRNEKHRTYSLGVAMVAIGHAAIEKHRGVEIARREVARLSVELGVQCSANALVDGDLVVLIKEGHARSHLGLTRVGERRPLLPPVGMCHVAWGSDATIEIYVAAARAHLSEENYAHLVAAFPMIRRRGFAIAGFGPTTGMARMFRGTPGVEVRDAAYWDRMFTLVGGLTPDEIQVSDIAAAAEFGISYLAAPVFSPEGSVAFTLVVSGLPSGIPAREIEACAARLCAAAATITSETHGRTPTVHAA